MQETATKKEFSAVVAAAATASVADQWPPDALQGVAFFSTERDQRITALASFSGLADALGDIPLVVTRFGASQATRIALQLVYEYFKAVGEPRVDEVIVDSTWASFLAELEEANWTTRGVANLRKFTSQIKHLDLGDGISIRGRHFEELRSLGFATPVLDRIASDWEGFGASSFVMVTESASPKNASEPDNLLSLDSATVWTKAMRAIGTLRLLAGGDVSIGPMWVVRVARFNVGLGGIQSTGVAIPALGTQYVWTDEIRSKYASVYAELARLEKVGYGQAPGNLDLALRAFMATYDRWPPGADSCLLDSVTALEAVLGSGTEIAFKLAFRVAALLAGDDEKRAAMFETVKSFYDTRSAIVHGGRLKDKHQQRLAKVDELRCLVRRLLRAFVAFAARGGQEYDRTFFQEHLDATLVNAAQRDMLRRSLGLATL